MKFWHSCIVVAVLAFIIGALYPAPVNFVRGKLGV